MKQIDLREGARRQHRAMGLLGVLQCWVRGLDGLVFDRLELERLLGLKRFKETRVAWLMEDSSEFFKSRRVFITEARPSIATLLVSRADMPSDLDTLGDYHRWCEEHKVRIANFSMWPMALFDHKGDEMRPLSPFFGSSVNSDERLLTAYMALVAAGQMSPLDIPGIQP